MKLYLKEQRRLPMFLFEFGNVAVIFIFYCKILRNYIDR